MQKPIRTRHRKATDSRVWVDVKTREGLALVVVGDNRWWCGTVSLLLSCAATGGLWVDKKVYRSAATVGVISECSFITLSASSTL